MALDGHIYALRIECRCSLAPKDLGGLIYVLMFKLINCLRLCELPTSTRDSSWGFGYWYPRLALKALHTLRLIFFMSDSLVAYPWVSSLIDGFNAFKWLLIAVWKYFLWSLLVGSIFDLKPGHAKIYAFGGFRWMYLINQHSYLLLEIMAL